MTNFDRAAAEISARTAELRAAYPHLTRPDSLASALRDGLAAIRRNGGDQAQDIADATDAIAPLPDLDPASIPADAREALEDAAEDEELARGTYQEAVEAKEAAEIALLDAQDALRGAEIDVERAYLASQIAQGSMAGTLRAYGMVRTATGYARRRI
jgi:hypothetical protein